MSPDEKLDMARLFPNARIVQHYGLTEASRTTFLDITDTPADQLEAVGRLDDAAVEVRIDDEGAICIRGAHVASQMLDPDGQLQPLVDEQGWLITKDRGVTRDGHLYFLGRLDDQINVSGIKLSSEHLEQRIAEALPQLAGYFAITAIEDPMRGQIPLIALERQKADSRPELEQAARAAVAHYGVAGDQAFRSMLVDRLPVTGSGKVQRARIRDLYRSEEKPVPARRKDRAATSVGGVFQTHFSTTEITRNTTFEDLGADSLNYLSVALDLERLLGELPDGWESMTVGELEKVDPKKGFWSRLDMPTAMRALAIFLIVAGHFDFINYGGGGALSLFFIAGMSFGAMTLPAIQSAGNASPIGILIIRIAVMAWLFISLNWLVTGYGSVPAYFFITNWISPGYPGGIWFIGVYIQLALALALLFSFARMRKVFRQKPFVASFSLSLGFIALMIASELMVDTHHLYRRLPNVIGWIYVCGVAAHFASTWKEKGLTAGLFLIGWMFFAGGLDLAYPWPAALALIFVPYIRIPRHFIPVARLVASASLMIYLSHFQFKSVVKIAGIDSPAVSTIAAVAGGTLIYMAYRHFDDWLRSILSKVLH